MPRRTLTVAIFLVSLLLSKTAAAQLPGGLISGPNAVGFKISEFGDTSPRIRVHIWYPAAAAAGAPLTIADYLGVSPARGEAGETFAELHRSNLKMMIGVDLSDAAWTAYSGRALTARRDAKAAAGPFPILIGMLRPISVVVQAEFLASHGYIVAFVEPRYFPTPNVTGLAREGAIMRAHISDMNTAIAEISKDPSADAQRVGAIGFSGDGLAQLALAMSAPDVRAVVQLESGWYGPAGFSSYRDVPEFVPANLRAAYLFTYGEDQGNQTSLQLADIRKMDASTRYVLRTREPRMGHWDFATEGSVLTELSQRPDRAGILRAFSTIYRYQLTFLDAFVKGDARATAALASVQPEPADGAPFDLTVWPARASGGPATTSTTSRRTPRE